MDWGQLLLASGIASAPALALVAWLKTRPQMKLAEVQGEAALWVRIKELETKIELSDAACEERLARVEKRHETDVTELKAEVRSLRHDRNNVRQGFNYMVMRLKRHADPELRQIAEDAEEMVATGDKAIALERGAIPAVKQRRATP